MACDSRRELAWSEREEGYADGRRDGQEAYAAVAPRTVFLVLSSQWGLPLGVYATREGAEARAAEIREALRTATGGGGALIREEVVRA